MLFLVYKDMVVENFVRISVEKQVLSVVRNKKVPIILNFFKIVKYIK